MKNNILISNQNSSLKVTLAYWIIIGLVLVIFIKLANGSVGGAIDKGYIPGAEFYFKVSGGSEAIFVLLLYLYVSLPIVSILAAKVFIKNKKNISREMIYISIFWVCFWCVFALYPELFLLDSGTRMGHLFVGLIRLSDISASLLLYIVFFAGVYGLSSIATVIFNRFAGAKNKA